MPNQKDFSTMDAPAFEYLFKDYPLAPATIYNVGGPARIALKPRTLAEAEEGYAWLLRQPGPKLVIGGGSNVLISDEGFPGIVFFTTELRVIEPLGNHRYWVEAGVALDDVVQRLILKENYAGAGGLTGIPGSVGGAIYMNAGTVNGSTCELLASVDLLNEGGRCTVAMEPSRYGYRGQTFCPPPGVIIGGTFRFTPTEEDQQAIYDHYIDRRRRTQPQGRCCGSVFKNPEGNHSGRMIESCGLKGTRRGGAVISEQHANFIMNDDNATFDDIIYLKDLAKQKVKEAYGIELEEEVKVIRVQA